MSLDSNDIYQAALDKWGEQTQAMMLMGECGELIAALNRYYTQGRNNSRHEIIDELVDVSILIDQMQLIVGKDRFDNAKKAKLIRLQRKLNFLEGGEDLRGG